MKLQKANGESQIKAQAQLNGGNIGMCLCLLYCLCILSACSNTRYLPDGKSLYVDSDVEIKSKHKVKNKSTLTAELNSFSSIRPNKRMLGLVRTRLSIFNRYQNDTSGIGAWLFENYAEEPVYMDSTLIGRSSESMSRFLFDRGYFYNKVSYTSETKKRKTSVVYKVELNEPYTIRKVIFPADTADAVTQLVRKNKEATKLKRGNNFSEQVLQEEMNRIAYDIRNRGYYDFAGRSFIHFNVDSTAKDRQLDVYVELKQPKDTIHQKYRIDTIRMYPEYFDRKEKAYFADTTIVEGVEYISSGSNRFKPEVLIETILIRRGWTYSQKNYELAINHLLELGVFKYVNIRFEKIPNTQLLNCYIYLTPNKVMSAAAEFEINNRSGSALASSLLGTAVTLSFQNRNSFRGAESFNFNIYSGVEWGNNINQSRRNLSVIDISGEFNLKIPRFVSPIQLNNISRYYLPITNISLGLGYIQGFESYRLNTYNFAFGYDWRESKEQRHIYNPFVISFIDFQEVLNPDLEQSLAQNAFLRKSFENRFIIGSNYAFIYTNQTVDKFRNFTFFKGNIDLSGNVFYAVKSLVKPLFPNSNTTDFLRWPYSRYVRLDADWRYYYYFPNTNVLVSRMYFGIGIPYGETENVLPFVKQFYIGGPNSLRAFPLRSIGPGDLPSGVWIDGESPNYYKFDAFDRTGEFKLEANLEYRFNMGGYFKGAFFGDMGNIWLIRQGEDQIGTFKVKNFINDLAIGVGYGLRLDFSYFILRVDLATPVRDPRRPAGQRWIFDPHPASAPWWQPNYLNLNLAVGYPF